MEVIRNENGNVIGGYDEGKIYDGGSKLSNEIGEYNIEEQVCRGWGLNKEVIGTVDQDGNIYKGEGIYKNHIGKCSLGNIELNYTYKGKYEGQNNMGAVATVLLLRDKFEEKETVKVEEKRESSYSGGESDFELIMGLIGPIYRFVVFDFFEDVFRKKRKMENKDYIVYMLYLFMMLTFYYIDVYNFIRGFEGERIEKSRRIYCGNRA
ncbi:MAG: hypothetical protein IJZ96_08360 [Lachnospiraceae bacterium]|nr:hypothetical protein [Lachnospiraceae bacterium]